MAEGIFNMFSKAALFVSRRPPPCVSMHACVRERKLTGDVWCFNNICLSANVSVEYPCNTSLQTASVPQSKQCPFFLYDSGKTELLSL